MQVANDIVQIQLPLPFPLKIVNCYALRDGAGWTIVDTGIHYPPGEAAWRAAFAAHGIDPATIARIVLTHAHPDHFGMAGWLADMSGAPVFISPGEAAFAQQVWFNGETNERTIEILEGLKEDERVVMNPRSHFSKEIGGFLG